MNKYSNPHKKPFQIGQLVRMSHVGGHGIFVILDIRYENFQQIWRVDVLEQRTGSTFTRYSGVFEPAGASDD